MLIPLSAFLNRVFPLSVCEDIKDELVNRRLFVPRKDCAKFELVLPINWEAEDMSQDRNWRMQLQGWAMFFPIMSFFDSYDDKNKVIDYFFDIAGDWYQNYGNDPNDIVTSRMPSSYAWYDMSVGFRALVIAFFLNRIVENNMQLTEQNSELLNALIIKHINHLSNESVFSLNNHGIFQIQGLMALIQLSKLKDYQQEYQYCLEKMVALITSQYSQQGIHLENSPHYHFYALNAFKNIVDCGWYAEKEIIATIVNKAESAKKWLVDPFKRPAGIGDSILTKQNLEFCIDEMTGALERKVSLGLLSNFSDSGYQIFRSHWNVNPKESSYLFLMGMYHTKSHKHRDCLSFEWFDNGEKIICDSGKYGYVSDKYRNYFLSYRAHNTVEIEDFDILKIVPYGSCIDNAEEKDGKIYFQGSLQYPAVDFNRELILKPNHWLIVKDKLVFKRKRSITQWFHINKKYQLKSLVGNRLVFTMGQSSLIMNSLDDTYETKVYRGDDELIQGFISEKDFTFEENYAVGFHKETIIGDECITILALSKEAEQDALEFIKNPNSKKSKKERNEQYIVFPERLINNIKNINRVSNSHRFDLLPGKHTYAYVVNGVQLFFFANIKSNSDKLTVMLPGAVNRNKTIYNFQRFSWSDEIDGSVIIFLDPTVSLENEITIGWFQGDKDFYAMPILEGFIKNLIVDNDFKEENLTLFGSSAGGFSCLKLANAFLNSIIKVINPQTIVYNYSENEVNKLISWIFPYTKGGLTKEQKERLRVILDLKSRTQPIFYYQNRHDGHHLHKHLKPLLDTISSDLYCIMRQDEISTSMLNIIYYNDAEKGHSPPSKDVTLQWLNN